jgi:hypothetical protein
MGPVVLAVIVIAAGCGRGTAPSPGANVPSGVEGRVLLSGGPLPAEGSPSPHPYALSEVLAFASSGRLVASVKPDQHAAFRIELPPGSYTLKARPTAGNPWFAPRKVSVHAGEFVRVDLIAQVP